MFGENFHTNSNFRAIYVQTCAFSSKMHVFLITRKPRTSCRNYIKQNGLMTMVSSKLYLRHLVFLFWMAAKYKFFADPHIVKQYHIQTIYNHHRTYNHQHVIWKGGLRYRRNTVLGLRCSLWAPPLLWYIFC